MSASSDKKSLKITKIVEDESLKFNVGSTETPGKVIKVYDVIYEINIGYHENKVKQPNLYQYRIKSGIQSKN